MNTITYKIYESANDILAAPWDTAPSAIPGFEGVATLFAWGKWVAILIAAGSFIAWAIHLSKAKKNSGDDDLHMDGLAKILVAVMAVSAVGTILGFFVTGF